MNFGVFWVEEYWRVGFKSNVATWETLETLATLETLVTLTLQ
jgi:hypothetical protein